MDFSPLLKSLNITITDSDLLIRAFTHRSRLNEHDAAERSNERLEFLGDAVLELVATEYLFKNFDQLDEGQLTSLRSALVRGKNLAKVARKIGLNNYMLLSKGEENSGGRNKDYILANMTEAFIGAIYIDQGPAAATDFIDKHILTTLTEIISQKLHIDPKTFIQELTQEMFGLTPTYQVVGESGPDHNKIFTMACYLGERKLAEGSDSSKQKAEQQAARLSIDILQSEINIVEDL